MNRSPALVVTPRMGTPAQAVDRAFQLGFRAVAPAEWADPVPVQAAAAARGLAIPALRLELDEPLARGTDIDALLGSVARAAETARAVGAGLLWYEEEAGGSDLQLYAGRDLALAKLQAVTPLLAEAGVILAVRYGTPEETAALAAEVDSPEVGALLPQPGPPAAAVRIEAGPGDPAPRIVETGALVLVVERTG